MLDLARSDTICALATAPGRAALAVVRVSGPRAFAVRDVVFRRRRAGAIPPRVAVVGDVVAHEDGVEVVVDEAVCTSFPAPRSVTGEDVVELSLHGSPLVVDVVLRALRAAGCRPAQPGEFTLRGVLSGRIDLARAEAVEAVIAARTTAALHAAQRALRGGLQERLAGPRAALVDVLAELEARLDFPDEPLGEADRGRLAATLSSACTALRSLARAAPRGRRLVEGARVVLYGPPNAGKSTLLNALVGHERALVHDEPGTTRDVLEAVVDIDGVPCTLVDVAGVRDDAAHPVEAAGIARAKAEVERADVVVVLVPPGEAPLPVTSTSAVLLVRSKSDLPAANDGGPGALAISARTGAGLDALRARLAALLGEHGVDDAEAVVQTARQEQALHEAAAAVDDAIAAFAASHPDEIVCSELRRAARSLDRLLGRDISADVLDLVFARFCIGK